MSIMALCASNDTLGTYPTEIAQKEEKVSGTKKFTKAFINVKEWNLPSKFNFSVKNSNYYILAILL